MVHRDRDQQQDHGGVIGALQVFQDCDDQQIRKALLSTVHEKMHERGDARNSPRPYSVPVIKMDG